MQVDYRRPDLSIDQQLALKTAASKLAREFDGTFGTETIERFPRCATAATRVHSRYERRVADAPISGVPVVIELGVRRFFCDHPVCPKRTFAEQIPGLTSRYARAASGSGGCSPRSGWRWPAAPAPGSAPSWGC
jgi:hypothetical protein